MGRGTEVAVERGPIFWWLSPKKDSNYQWWVGYQKVRIVILPDSEKQKYLKKQNKYAILRQGNRSL